MLIDIDDDGDDDNEGDVSLEGPWLGTVVLFSLVNIAFIVNIRKSHSVCPLVLTR